MNTTWTFRRRGYWTERQAPVTLKNLDAADQWVKERPGRTVEINPVNPTHPRLLQTPFVLTGAPDQVAGITQWLGGVPAK